MPHQSRPALPPARPPEGGPAATWIDDAGRRPSAQFNQPQNPENRRAAQAARCRLRASGPANRTSRRLEQPRAATGARPRDRSSCRERWSRASRHRSPRRPLLRESRRRADIAVVIELGPHAYAEIGVGEVPERRSVSSRARRSRGLPEASPRGGAAPRRPRLAPRRETGRFVPCLGSRQLEFRPPPRHCASPSQVGGLGNGLPSG